MVKYRKILVAVLFQILLYSPVTYASFDKAMEIYSAGNFNEAKAAFEALAAIGDRSALFNLGVMYYRGEAVEKDSVKAYTLMKIANNGLDDEFYSRIANSIFGKFNESKRNEAEKLHRKIDPIYNISTISANIFPKPLADEDCAPDIKPLKKVAPRYPRLEAKAGRMGLVHMEYTISPEGYPRDIVADKSTSKKFTRASVRATRKFLYEPPLDKKPIYGHRTTMIFQMVNDKMNVQTKTLTKELDELEEAASNGDVIAQYSYASRLNTFRYFKSYLEEVDLQYKTANEWFIKSAKSGLPHAQYEIGRNMIRGRGCEVDIVNGFKWINAAAIGGFSPAQTTLARSALLKSDVSSEKLVAAVGWLRNAAQSNNFAAKLLLAWELSTSNINELRNGKEALELLKADPGNYFDEVRIMETKAAAYAEIGDFKKALKLQKKAAKAALKQKWDIPLISERVSLYKRNETYRGSYY